MNKKTLKEYRIWKAMKSRCYSPSNEKSYYQKDHIKVCDEWKNNFEKFMLDMGEIPKGDYSIERVDFKKDYCPENCKWILMNEQQKNRRSCLLFTYNNETKILKDWAKYFNISYTTLYQRIYRQHLSFEEAIKEDIHNRLFLLNGENKTINEWCKEFNISPGNVYSRIHRGWSKEDALLKPFISNKERGKDNGKT